MKAYRARQERGATAPEGRCVRCDQTKPADQFRANWHRSSGLDTICHDCRSHMNRTRTHGVSDEQYFQMLEEQKGLCAICGKSEQARVGHGKDRIRSLAVDHDHQTGKIRGLLCGNCNKGIGNLGDSIELLLAAIDYLTDGAQRRASGGEFGK